MKNTRRFLQFGGAVVLLTGAVAMGATFGPPAGASNSWSIVSSPNPPPNQDNALSGVSCTRPSACTAVGSYFNGQYQTLIESSNGSVWSIVPSPNRSTDDLNFLTAVSCTRSSACTAVGYEAGIEAQGLIESWNGQVWSIVPNPEPSLPSSLLNGVTCTRPSTCIAVGNQGVAMTLIESWNGQVWSVVPSPNPLPTQINDLNGVTCTRPSACIAVGYYGDRSGEVHALIESWNGQVWAIVPDATASLPTSRLNSVTCTRPSACTAVGVSGATDQTLIESWNGSVWSIVPSPDSSPTQVNDLVAVSCSDHSACIASGWYVNGGVDQTLIESWNGSVWSIVPSPNSAPDLQNRLTGASCNRPSVCTVVGSQLNGSSTFETLVETSARAH